MQNTHFMQKNSVDICEKMIYIERVRTKNRKKKNQKTDLGKG